MVLIPEGGSLIHSFHVVITDTLSYSRRSVKLLGTLQGMLKVRRVFSGTIGKGA